MKRSDTHQGSAAETAWVSLRSTHPAVLDAQGRSVRYQVQANYDLFDRVTATVDADGLRTEITAGVSEVERVVSKGAILVKLAQAAGAIDVHSGHVH